MEAAETLEVVVILGVVEIGKNKTLKQDFNELPNVQIYLRHEINQSTIFTRVKIIKSLKAVLQFVYSKRWQTSELTSRHHYQH